MSTRSLSILAIATGMLLICPNNWRSRAFVPVIALSSDKKLTSTNIPWIFRLRADTTPATALRMLVTAAGRSGANSEKLRNVLASGNSVAGVSFLATGEPKQH